MRKFFLLSLITFIVFLSFINSVQAEVKITPPISAATIQELIEDIIEVIRNLVMILTPIMITVAGIFYITSTGIPERIQKAKDFLIYAIIGIAIVLAAQAALTTMRTIFQ